MYIVNELQEWEYHTWPCCNMHIIKKMDSTELFKANIINRNTFYTIDLNVSEKE
jgi:hypothetical protein